MKRSMPAQLPNVVSQYQQIVKSLAEGGAIHGSSHCSV